MSNALDNVPAITDEDLERFGIVRGLFAEASEQLTLVRSVLDGKPVAVVVLVQLSGDEFAMTPLAVLVDDSLFEALADPMSLTD